MTVGLKKDKDVCIYSAINTVSLLGDFMNLEILLVSVTWHLLQLCHWLWAQEYAAKVNADLRESRGSEPK